MKYISKSLLRSISGGGNMVDLPKCAQLTEVLLGGGRHCRAFELVVIQVVQKEGDWDLLAASVIQEANQASIYTGGVVPPYLCFYLGLLNGDATLSDKRRSFVRGALAKFGENIKVIHGRFHGVVSSFGQTGPIGIPENASSIFSSLGSVEFGNQKELT